MQIHVPNDPLCKCERCSQLRAEAIERIDKEAAQRRSQEVVVESALRAKRAGKNK